jgi:hypothetical protein
MSHSATLCNNEGLNKTAPEACNLTKHLCTLTPSVILTKSNTTQLFLLMKPPLQIQQSFCAKVTQISHTCQAILDRQTRWEFSLQINWNRYSECRCKQTGRGTPPQPTFYDMCLVVLEENHVN